jgi:deoxyribodipyrimidine photolyase
MKSIGSNGSGNGQFYYLTGIKFNYKSYMFVVVQNNHKIAKFDENMQFVKPFVSEKKEIVGSTVLVVL